jgi:spermidine/putrescine transport system permease protein
MKRLLKILMGFIYFIFYIPLLVLAFYSFNDSSYALSFKGFTLKWYQSLWEKDLLMESLLNSLKLSICSSFLSVLFGTLFAYAFYRFTFKTKSFFQGALIFLSMTPDILLGMGLLILFFLFNWELGFSSLLISHTTICLPFVVGIIITRLRQLEPSLQEAAFDLGASESQFFFRIILPMIKRSLYAAWLLSLTLSLDDVVVSFFVSGPGFEILPLKIYSLVRVGLKPEVSAYATCFFMVSLLVGLISVNYLKDEKL